uniref:Uncharacterized protein n=1 Tax=Salix viminalis TaxID=40686 RepID=A0A6N2KT76_SALVM
MKREKKSKMVLIEDGIDVSSHYILDSKTFSLQAQGFSCSILLFDARQLLELTALPTPPFHVRQVLELWARCGKIDLDEQMRLRNIDGSERKNIAYRVVFPFPSC